MVKTHDASSIIVHLAAKILELSISAMEKVKSNPIESSRRPDIAYELLIILNCVDELLEIFNPSNTKLSRKFKFSNELNWDFRPWYCEKSESIKSGVKLAIQTWEKDISTIKLRPDIPMTPEQYINEGLMMELHRVNRESQKIFDMTFEDKIVVVEIID